MFKLNGKTPVDFDQKLADSFVGKYILIGINLLNPEGVAVERVERHGVVVSADKKGIKVSLRGAHDGETYVLPPDLAAIRPGENYRYPLVNGEEVDSPDLITTWKVKKPVKK